MTKPPAVTIDGYRSLLGQEVGISRWIDVDQPRIDAFAEATLDRQFIHVDPERAGTSPFGGTIAHGFLCLALLSRMSFEALPLIEGVAFSINYGMNRLRFIAPVPSGSRIRGRFLLKAAEAKAPDQFLVTHEVTVEIEGHARPALVAEWLILHRTEMRIDRKGPAI